MSVYSISSLASINKTTKRLRHQPGPVQCIGQGESQERIVQVLVIRLRFDQNNEGLTKAPILKFEFAPVFVSGCQTTPSTSCLKQILAGASIEDTLNRNCRPLRLTTKPFLVSFPVTTQNLLSTSNDSSTSSSS